MNATRLDKLLALQKADPADAELCYMIALEHAKVGAHSAALAALDQALSLNAGFHYAYYQKGKCLLAMGDQAGADATLRAGLERARRDGNAKAAGEIGDLLGGVG